MKTYHLFVSHSWNYSDTYDGLVNLLRQAPYFQFSDYSVPRNDPIHSTGTDAELRAAIRAKMASCSVVLILAGVYATYSKWINAEISLAQNGFIAQKSIIAIQPWGSERTSVPVKEAAGRIVGWNTNSIVSAIRELA